MKYQNPVHIVAARRTPIGKFGGSFKELTPLDLGLQVAKDVISSISPESLDAVILGQVLQAGGGMNISRQVALGLGCEHRCTAWTLNMVCGSGLKSVADAADLIDWNRADLVLAGGVENMSQSPYLDMNARWGARLGDARLIDSIMHDGLSDPFLKVGMGETAERVAEQYGITRDAQDRFALLSQQRVAASRQFFQREILPIQLKKGICAEDEHPRADTSLDKLAALRPAFRPDGTVTAGNSSGINDGAAMVLLASEQEVARRNLVSRARIVGATSVGCDPATMGMGPVFAIRALLADLEWDLSEVPVVEINEAFAAQAVACRQELGLDQEQLNPRGGGIALGHPIGCSGTRVLVTLLHQLEDLNQPRGIAALCIGGGMGIAMAIERG